MKDILVVLDVETTGLDAKRDWIIQLSAVKVKKENFEIVEEFSKYICPPVDFEMAQGAQEAHGLTKEFILEKGEPLKESAEEFIKFIDGCDVAGYNSNSFDIKFLYSNFQKVGVDMTMDHQFYDVMLMEAKLHPRTLIKTYENYVGKKMEDMGLSPHDALSDVKATATVMNLQMIFNDLKWDEINEWSENQLVSPEGSIRKDQNGRILFNTGKYKDNDIYDIMKRDPQYVQWWSKSVSTNYSREMARTYCKECQRKEKEQ